MERFLGAIQVASNPPFVSPVCFNFAHSLTGPLELEKKEGRIETHPPLAPFVNRLLVYSYTLRFRCNYKMFSTIFMFISVYKTKLKGYKMCTAYKQLSCVGWWKICKPAKFSNRSIKLLYFVRYFKKTLSHIIYYETISLLKIYTIYC